MPATAPAQVGVELGRHLASSTRDVRLCPTERVAVRQPPPRRRPCHQKYSMSMVRLLPTYARYGETAKLALWPPNPSEFDSATF